VSVQQDPSTMRSGSPNAAPACDEQVVQAPDKFTVWRKLVLNLWRTSSKILNRFRIIDHGEEPFCASLQGKRRLPNPEGPYEFDDGRLLSDVLKCSRKHSLRKQDALPASQPLKASLHVFMCSGHKVSVRIEPRAPCPILGVGASL